MAARDEFPEHDRVLRDWFAAHGWPVTESFDHVDADIRAWRHSGTEWRCTLHVAKEVLDRNDAASLVMLLDQRFTADTLRQLPNARQFSVTGVAPGATPLRRHGKLTSEPLFSGIFPVRESSAWRGVQ